MIRFFRQTLDHTLTAPSAYLPTLQQVFMQDQGSGLIEVEIDSETQLCQFYLEGKSFGSYRVAAGKCEPAPLSILGDLPSQKEFLIRSLELPSQAIRVLWQALEWYPPQPLGEIKLAELGAYLESLKANHPSGLLYLSSDEVDGFICLVKGMVIPSVTVLSTSRGFEDNLANFHFSTDKLVNLFWYEMADATLSASDLLLLNAVINWTNSFINGYQLMVGYNLINALNYDVNTALRLRRWNLRLVGTALVNHHLFFTRETIDEAYRFLFKRLMDHTTRVLGDKLTQRILGDSFKILAQDEKDCLAKSGLSPEALV